MTYAISKYLQRCDEMLHQQPLSLTTGIYQHEKYEKLGR